MDEIKNLLDKIKLSSRDEMQYSIMPLLYEKITAKELLHSDIIASLIDSSSGNKSSSLNPQGFNLKQI